MKTDREQLAEDARLRQVCEECGLCSGENTRPVECQLGNPRLEDYQTEYRLFDKVVQNDSDVIEESETERPRIVKFSEHRHVEALTVSLALANGFIVKKKVCSVCREVYETQIYRDKTEHKRLTEKVRKRA